MEGSSLGTQRLDRADAQGAQGGHEADSVERLAGPRAEAERIYAEARAAGASLGLVVAAGAELSAHRDGREVHQAVRHAVDAALAPSRAMPATLR